MRKHRRFLAIFSISLGAVAAGAASRAVQDQCGPFTDVSAAFCPYVLEMYYLGITAGTSPTTYSPDNPVTRGQAAVFVSKGVNQAIARSSRRAALGQWWTTQDAQGITLTTVGTSPFGLKCDGKDVWVSDTGGGTVARVNASDGRLLETWTGAANAIGVVVAFGRVLVTGYSVPGTLYMIDPTQPAGAVTLVADNLGDQPIDVAFDGTRVWTANRLGPSVSIVTPAASLPWPATTIPVGAAPLGLAYDGTHMWVTDNIAGTLLKLDSDANILQTIPVGSTPEFPVFDGSNIWVPNAGSNSISIVRAATGTVVTTLTGNGLASPIAAAFDGERILITNQANSSVSLWTAADLSPLGSVAFGSAVFPFRAASDGVNFWITLFTGQLARF